MKPLRSSFYFGVFFLLLLGLLFGLGVLFYLYFPFSHATEASATERNTTGVQPATQKRHEWYDKYENDRYLSRLGFFKNLDKETYEAYLKIFEEDINTESAVTTRTIADKSNEARGNGSITGTETQEEKILPGMIPNKTILSPSTKYKTFYRGYMDVLPLGHILKYLAGLSCIPHHEDGLLEVQTGAGMDKEADKKVT